MSGAPSKTRLRFETVGSISAIVVGVAALYVGWDQARVMREQQHASVLPAIQIGGFIREDGERVSTGVDLRNNGVGPAFIHQFAMSLDGEALSGWRDLISRAPGDPGWNWATVSGRVLGPGEHLTAIELFWTAERAAGAEGLAEFLSRATETGVISVCYCSAFDRCYTSRSSPEGQSLPERVPACPDAPRWDDRIPVASD